MIIVSTLATLVIIGCLDVSKAEEASCQCTTHLGSKSYQDCYEHGSAVKHGGSAASRQHKHGLGERLALKASTFGIGATISHGTLGRFCDHRKEITTNNHGRNRNHRYGGRTGYSIRENAECKDGCGCGSQISPQLSLTASTKIGDEVRPAYFRTNLKSPSLRLQYPSKFGIAVPAHPGREDRVDLSTRFRYNCDSSRLRNGDTMADFEMEKEAIPFDQQEKIYNNHGPDNTDLSEKADPISLRIALNRQMSNLNKRPIDVPQKKVIIENKLSYGPHYAPIDGSVPPKPRPELPEQQLQTVSRPVLELKHTEPIFAQPQAPLVSYSVLGYGPVKGNKKPFIDYSAPRGPIPAHLVEEIVPSAHKVLGPSTTSTTDEEPPCGPLAQLRPGYQSGSIIFPNVQNPPTSGLNPSNAWNFKYNVKLNPHFNANSNTNPHFSSFNRCTSDVSPDVQQCD